ncbi:alpha/beta hydrolase [Agitococcus lubricus]|uniref:Phospholipase/carboxylesterase n=1 Tax=Agitococcus lubricus TaxID=1077255 RepID=A0A2T5J0U5_9GAMM|nr:carboxylesterase [Agitococcus lubricus]PTQ90016.1 phospholipase/carboxylesterase [Agitococcus lubricus]
MMELHPIEINPATPATAAVIWLHGLGASGDDFVPIIPELKLPKTLAIRFIFPQAPQIAVTINGGYIMPAWYDITAMNLEREIDESQLLASSDAIKQLIDREVTRGIPSERIFLAGFSQGGAVAYHTALTYHRPLGGLLALSTYFATHKHIVIHPANQHLPIAIFHGIYDSVVNELLGNQALHYLRNQGYQPYYRSYEMEHEVCLEEVMDISNWLQARLK